MMRSLWKTALCSLSLSTLTSAGFPAQPEGISVLQSRFGDGVSISYKETSICETTDGVRGYAGYVHLPPGTLEDLGETQDYPINTFFWFFEARQNPQNAPLSIWMNGGPGSSSMLGLLSENGPCAVNPDSKSTVLNPWSWNNEVNMLYLDQPTQVGLSYDTLANITVNTVTGNIVLLNEGAKPKTNATYLTGTYASQNSTHTAIGSRNAAIALWHFAQTWFQEFPFYQPNDGRISLSTESYGGRYGPAFFSFFEEQNQKIENGTFRGGDGEMYVLHLDTLLIINGCIDRQVQWPSYPHIAWNNTYGIKTVNDSVYQDMMTAYTSAGGCRDQIDTCRQLASLYDPDNIGSNETVNSICQDAETYCSTNVRGPYLEYSGRNYYDFTQKDPDPFPPPFYEGYLNQPNVQAALGVPLNWSASSSVVAAAFRSIGDYPRPGWLEDLAYLLDNNIKVTLVYGDRDYACNWIGGEAVSQAIPYSNTTAFNSAGYAPIQTNDSYVGGQVRQHGNLSFSRVYEAGHEVPSYQPETAYRIFMRALFNQDIATGKVNTLTNTTYSTEGPSSSWQYKNEAPAQYKQFCYVLDPTSLCTEAQINAVENGTAEIVNYIVVDKNSTQLFPAVAQQASGSQTGNGGASATGSAGGSSQTGGGGGSEGGAGRIGDGKRAWCALVLAVIAGVFLI